MTSLHRRMQQIGCFKRPRHAFARERFGKARCVAHKGNGTGSNIPWSPWNRTGALDRGVTDQTTEVQAESAAISQKMVGDKTIFVRFLVMTNVVS